MRDRRFHPQRTALVRRIIDEVLSQRWFALDSGDCARLLGISGEACERILRKLEEAGLVRETRPGMWVRPAHIS